jgi:hypothetical protein
MKIPASVSVLALVSRAQSFTPLPPASMWLSSSLSATVTSSTGTKTKFGGTPVGQQFQHVPHSSRSSTRTSLSMMVGSGGGNMLDRFVRVVNSNINRFISGIENPEKVIIQALEERQGSGANTPLKDRSQSIFAIETS